MPYSEPQESANMATYTARFVAADHPGDLFFEITHTCMMPMSDGITEAVRDGAFQQIVDVIAQSGPWVFQNADKTWGSGQSYTPAES